MDEMTIDRFMQQHSAIDLSHEPVADVAKAHRILTRVAIGFAAAPWLIVLLELAR